MSDTPPIIDAADAFLGRLAALDMQAAQHVHACLIDATKPDEVADLSRAYARASRCLRQTLALHARLKTDRERGMREAERHAAQMARDGAAPAGRLDRTPDRDRTRLDSKIEAVREALDRIVTKAADGDLTRHTRLVHRFERELDDWVETDDFLGHPLDGLVERACRTLDLPATLARTWRDLPQATFFPEPEALAALDDDDDGAEAGAEPAATARADFAHGDPPHGTGEPPDPGADPALRRGSG